MSFMEIIAQIIGVFAMIFVFLSYQQKTQSRVILCQLFGSVFFATHYFMIGAIVGGLMNCVGIVRALVFLNKDKLKAERLPWLIGFILVYFCSYVLTFALFGKEFTVLNAILEIFPVIGMTVTTIAFRYKEARMTRLWGLINSPSWLIYNVASGSIAASLCEGLNLISIIIGMVRLDRKKKISSEETAEQ